MRVRDYWIPILIQLVFLALLLLAAVLGGGGSTPAH